MPSLSKAVLYKCLQGSIKRSSVVAALPGRQLKCSNFPGRKKEKGKRNRRKDKKGKKAKKEGMEGEINKERTVKRDRVGWYRERRRKCVKINERAYLATRKRNIF